MRSSKIRGTKYSTDVRYLPLEPSFGEKGKYQHLIEKTNRTFFYKITILDNYVLNTKKCQIGKGAEAPFLFLEGKIFGADVDVVLKVS